MKTRERWVFRQHILIDIRRVRLKYKSTGFGEAKPGPSSMPHRSIGLIKTLGYVLLVPWVCNVSPVHDLTKTVSEIVPRNCSFASKKDYKILAEMLTSPVLKLCTLDSILAVQIAFFPAQLLGSIRVRKNRLFTQEARNMNWFFLDWNWIKVDVYLFV